MLPLEVSRTWLGFSRRQKPTLAVSESLKALFTVVHDLKAMTLVMTASSLLDHMHAYFIGFAMMARSMTAT